MSNVCAFKYSLRINLQRVVKVKPKSIHFSGELDQETDTWILIGDPSRKHPSVHCKR